MKAKIARLVVKGSAGDPAHGEAMLLDVLRNKWPAGQRVKFLITPGGFVVGTFPNTVLDEVGWGSRPADFRLLRKHAEAVLRKTVTARVTRAALTKADAITVGVDLWSENGTQSAELVAVLTPADRRVRWTGKSYPTSGQASSLFQVVDLKTHLIRVAGVRALVLGCHDLNMFSRRGRANQTEGGDRRRRCNEMRRLAKAFRPTVVLQHPHSTDSARIWGTAWGGLVRDLPSVTDYASAIAYCSWNGRPRTSLERVLEGTQKGGCVDLVASKRAAGRAVAKPLWAKSKAAK